MGKGDHLGEFEQLVLLALIRLEDEGYGMKIRQTIEARTGRSASIGQVYASLERLETKGIVRGRTVDPEPVRGGRAKRLYTLTEKGAAQLVSARRMVELMAEGLTLPGQPAS